MPVSTGGLLTLYSGGPVPQTHGWEPGKPVLGEAAGLCQIAPHSAQSFGPGQWEARDGAQQAPKGRRPGPASSSGMLLDVLALKVRMIQRAQTECLLPFHGSPLHFPVRGPSLETASAPAGILLSLLCLSGEGVTVRFLSTPYRAD